MRANVITGVLKPGEFRGALSQSPKILLGFLELNLPLIRREPDNSWPVFVHLERVKFVLKQSLPSWPHRQDAP